MFPGRRQPEQVNAHGFPGDAQCRAIPYGVYDLTLSRGRVCVGSSAETPEFAVRSIRDWWRRFGQSRIPARAIC